MHSRYVILFTLWPILWCDGDGGSNRPVDKAPTAAEQHNPPDDETAEDGTLHPDRDVGSLANQFGTATLNPSGAAPLTAEIPFTPDRPGTLTIVITCPAIDNGEAISERFSFTAGKSIPLPILGLYSNCINCVTVTLFDEHGNERGTHTVSIATAPLPDDFPAVTATGTYGGSAFTFVTYYRARIQTEEDEVADGVPEVIDKTVPEITGIMFDKTGRVRWYSVFTYKFLFPMEFIDGYIYGGDWVTDTGLLQWYDLMGRQAGTIDIGAFGFVRVHHDVVRKPDGHLIHHRGRARHRLHRRSPDRSRSD